MLTETVGPEQVAEVRDHNQFCLFTKQHVRECDVACSLVENFSIISF